MEGKVENNSYKDEQDEKPDRRELEREWKQLDKIAVVKVYSAFIELDPGEYTFRFVNTTFTSSSTFLTLEDKNGVRFNISGDKCFISDLARVLVSGTIVSFRVFPAKVLKARVACWNCGNQVSADDLVCPCCEVSLRGRAFIDEDFRVE
jgi:hypothetical protein